jgi:ABC-type multidrug transport system ATPase subunit
MRNTDKFDLAVKVTNLRKVYVSGVSSCTPSYPHRAIENLSFGLERGECFALLGVNGAGKSTTFKILTNEEEATAGKIKVEGLDLRRNFSKVRKMIGYCPQYHSFFDTLTVD